MKLTHTAWSLVRWLKGLDSDTKVVALFVAIALVRGILYALLSPPFSAPDEKGHYDYVASLYQNGWEAIEGKESKQPPLYYLLTLPFYSAFASHTSDIEVYALASAQVSLLSLLAVRIVSVLFTATTVAIAYRTARTVCPNDRFVCLGSAAFTALLPAYGWIGASINNDSLANMVSSALILLLLQGIARGFTVNRSLLMAVLIIAGVATKPTTLPAASFVPVVIGLSIISRRYSARWAAMTGLLAVAVSALFLTSPARMLVLGPLGAIMKREFTLDFLMADKVQTFFASLDVWPFVYQFKTFWGSFSNDSVQMPPLLYTLLAAVTLLSLVGLAARIVAVRGWTGGGSRVRAVQVSVLGGIAMLEWLISFSRFYTNQSLGLNIPIAGWDDDFALLQGRFLFPAIVPIAFLFVWGLRALLPPNWAKHATWILVATLMIVDWVALGALALGGRSWQTYPG